MNSKLRFVLNLFGWFAAAIALVVLAGVVAIVVLQSRYEARAAKFDLTKIDEVSERSAIYDGNGEFYSYFGGENRLVVPLASVSKRFIEALIAREDTRFWEHRGVDTQGVLRAMVMNLRAGETKQGGSTITQQLARNACGLGERSLDRKALEAVLAQRIEATYTKEQILELYVNRIYFGSGYNGIETAARGYFGKSAADLTLGESAALAGLIRNPNRLAPSRNLAAASEQRDVVLKSMAELKFITAEEQAAARAQELRVSNRSTLRVTDDAVMDAVLREMGTLLAPETLEYGGLKVSMTIDPQLQRMAEAATDRRLSEIEEQKNFPHPKKRDFVPEPDAEKEKPTDYLQASVAIIENSTGAVRAVVGGRDYSQSKYSRALLSKRQIGSTFKPFVYAAAFERGLLPGTQIDDSKLAAGEFRDVPKKWSPENSDGEYEGMQPAALGLLKSKNTMSVRVGEYASMPKVREVAQAVGLNEIPDLPVVFLGGFESTVKDLTAAYSMFPNHGIYHPPHLIAKVEDREGRVLYTAPKSEKRVVSADTSWMVSGILQQIMKTGTASKAAALGWKKNGAGKTGTTNDFFDAWYVGYTSSLTCGVWVGMDQPKTIMEKGYGSALALPIWVDIMQQVPEQRYPSAPFAPPMQLTKLALCSVSGARATSTCAAQRCAYESQIPSSRVPNATCPTHPESVGLPVAVMPMPSAPPPAGMAPATVLETRIAGEQMPSTMPPPARMSAEQVIAPGRRQDSIPRSYLPPQPSVIDRGVPVAEAVPEMPVVRAEVRRAIPVAPAVPAAVVESSVPPAPLAGERRVVERLPDGRTKTTIFRTVRTTPAPSNTTPTRR